MFELSTLALLSLTLSHSFSLSLSGSLYCNHFNNLLSLPIAAQSMRKYLQFLRKIIINFCLKTFFVAVAVCGLLKCLRTRKKRAVPAYFGLIKTAHPPDTSSSSTARENALFVADKRQQLHCLIKLIEL